MRALLLLCSFLFSPAIALAHSDGLSFERQTGDILIDIGFGKELPVPGSTLTYSFDLFKVGANDSYTFEPFTKVSVRILNEDKELIAKTLPNNGTDVPSLKYTFTEPGDYSMAVAYERAGKESVDAAFGFRVTDPSTSSTVSSASSHTLTVNPLTALIGGVILLLILARMIFLFRKKD